MPVGLPTARRSLSSRHFLRRGPSTAVGTPVGTRMRASPARWYRQR